MACYLPDSEKEVAWVYLTKEGTTSTLLDLTGTRVLLDGGAQINDMFKLFRHPEVAVVTVATSATLNNAVELNKTNYLPVVGRVPKVNGNSSTALAIKELESHHAHVLTPKVIDSKKIEPQVIYKSLRAGTLELYPLSGDAKEIEALQKAIESGDEQKIMEAASNASVVSLIVWVPTRRDHFVKRILHTGLAPYKKIVEGLEKLKSLPLVDKPSITVEEYKKGGLVKSPTVIKLGASVPSKPTGAVRVASTARTAATLPPVARISTRPIASPVARVSAARPVAPATRTSTARPASTKLTPNAGRSTPGSTKPNENISKTTAPAKPGRTATGPARPAAAADKPLTKKTVGSSQGAAPSRLDNKGAAPPKSIINTATKVAGAVGAGVVAANVASKEAEPAADPLQSATEPVNPPLDDSVVVVYDKKEAIFDDSIQSLVSVTDGTSQVNVLSTIEAIVSSDAEQLEQSQDLINTLNTSSEDSHMVHSNFQKQDQHKEESTFVSDDGLNENPTQASCHESGISPPIVVKSVVSDSILQEHHPDSNEPSESAILELVEPSTPEPAFGTSAPSAPSEPVSEMSESSESTQHNEVEVAIPFVAVDPSLPSTDVITTPSDVEDPMSEYKIPTPEPVNEEGLLEVGELPMTLRKVSMDTDDMEAEKIVEQLNKDVKDAVKECENVIEQDAQRFRNAEETDLLKKISPSPMIPLDEGLADTSIGDSSVTGVLCGAMEHMSLDGSPKSIETSLNMDSGSSLNESSDAYSPRKESTQAEVDLLGSLSSPFTTGLASTIASKIIDGATIEGAKKNAEGLLDHVLGEFDQLSNAVEHKVENAFDNLANVGRKISQDFNALRSTTFSHSGEGEEPREIQYEETDPAIEKVLDTLSNESGEVDRKLSTANTPIEESHINGNGHDVQHGHDFPPGVIMHLPSRVPGKLAVPRSTKSFYFDLVFAPRVGTETAFKDAETATAYFTHVRAANIVLPSDNLPTFVLDSWLRAKNLSSDRAIHSTLLPTIESANVTAFRHMNEEELLQNNLTLKLGLDHCTTKVIINDEERPFNVVKLDL